MSNKGLFNIQYPPRFYLGLDGGKNNRVAKQWLLDNESPNCQNVVFGFGSVETRHGTNKLNTSTVGTYVCDGLYTRHDDAGVETMCAWFGGHMLTLGSTTFTTVPSGQSAFTAGARIYTAEYENNMFIGNGGVIPYRYTGTDLVRHGIYPPTATSTVATGTTSNSSILSGVYSWKVTYVNSFLVESDLGPVTATFTGSGSTGAYLTSIPVAPQSYGVAKRYVYRTDNSGVAYYRAGTVNNNTATTFVDTLTDVELGAAAPTDNGVPPIYTAIIHHQSRLFMIDPTSTWIWYTELANPYVVKATNFRRIGDATTDIPKAIGTWDNYLVVFCKNSTWMVYMPDTDDSNWIDFKLRSQFGSVSPFAVFSAQNKLFFGATQNGKFMGFAGLTAAGVDPEATMTQVGSVGSDLTTDRIKDDMDKFVPAYLKNMSSIMFDDKAYIAYTDTGLTTNTKILVIDFSTENLSKKQKITFSPWTGLQASQFCVYGGNLYYGSANDVGFVYRMNNGTYSDDSTGTPTAIDSYVWTKEYAGDAGHEAWQKDWRFANILYDLAGDWFMGISTRVDSDAGSGLQESIDCNPGTNLWGAFAWGNANWEAGRSEKDIKKPLGQFRGKRIQFKFSNLNTVATKFKVVGLSLTYNLKGRR